MPGELLHPGPLINVSRNGRLADRTRKTLEALTHEYCHLAAAAAPACSIVISRLTQAIYPNHRPCTGCPRAMA
ncbi:hypothetical protein METHP14_560010 [Pseudomonas sp. P14-2025]